MEEILDLYEEAYDPKRPVLCMDERPCQLIGDVVVPIPMKSGKAMKYDYEYERKGTCCVFIICEPLTLVFRLFLIEFRKLPKTNFLL